MISLLIGFNQEVPAYISDRSDLTLADRTLAETHLFLLSYRCLCAAVWLITIIPLRDCRHINCNVAF